MDTNRSVFWKTTSLGSRILFFAGVFWLFASVGFVSLLLRYQYLAPSRTVITVLIVGLLAACCAAAGIARKHWIIPIIAIGEGVLFTIIENHYHSPELIPAGSPLRTQIALLAIGAIISIVAGYIFFVVFFSQQGARYFRAKNEIAMAGEIHRSLVPPIERTLGCYELYGRSVPSGEVGGDLVDVTGDDRCWTGYVADVSGHGVSAGLLMAMFKTAVRMRAGDTSPEVLLQEVHKALYPLKTNNMFVTAGFIGCRDDRLTLCLAAHPALLQYRRKGGTVEEHATIDLPLGILPEQMFQARPLECEPGDVLLLLTDGLTEVFDKAGKEMGVEPIKAVLARSANLPLPKLFEQIRSVALAAGHQDDDQTMLLVRKRVGQQQGA